MNTREEIQSYIDRLEGGALSSNEVQEGLWVVQTSEDTEVVVHYAPPRRDPQGAGNGTPGRGTTPFGALPTTPRV